MGTTERTTTIPNTPAVAVAIASLAPAAPADDLAVVAETTQIQRTGLEIAMLGTTGSNIKDAESSSAIETLRGDFSGLKSICQKYAAFKGFAPGTDIGIGLSKEYEAAIAMRRGNHSSGTALM
jgi:hypothetical protein